MKLISFYFQETTKQSIIVLSRIWVDSCMGKELKSMQHTSTVETATHPLPQKSDYQSMMKSVETTTLWRLKCRKVHRLSISKTISSLRMFPSLCTPTLNPSQSRFLHTNQIPKKVTPKSIRSMNLQAFATTSIIFFLYKPCEISRPSYVPFWIYIWKCV